MNETLRPSTLGEILDRIFQIYRSNFWRILGIAALPLAAIFVLAIPIAILLLIPGIAAGRSAPGSIAGVIALGICIVLLLPVYLAFYALTIAGVTEAAVSAHRGRGFTIRATLAGAWRRLGVYLWLLVLQLGLVCLLPISAAGALCWPLIYPMFKSGVGAAAGVALGFSVVAVAAAAFGVIAWLGLSLSMAMAVCVVEKKTAWQSLRRAWRLSNGTRGRISVLYLLMLALSMVATTISYIVMAIGVLVSAFVGKDSPLALILMGVSAILYVVASVGIQTALMPLPWLGLVLFYFDQRVRKEGYDIEWMMQQAGLAAAPPTLLQATPSGGFPPVTPPDTLGER